MPIKIVSRADHLKGKVEVPEAITGHLQAMAAGGYASRSYLMGYVKVAPETTLSQYITARMAEIDRAPPQTPAVVSA